MNQSFSEKVSYRAYANISVLLLVVCFVLMVGFYIDVRILTSENERLHKAVALVKKSNSPESGDTRTATALKKRLSDTEQTLALATAELEKQKLLLKNTRLVVEEQKQLIATYDNLGTVKSNGAMAFYNNNPLNIKRSGNGELWKGQISVDGFGHGVFRHPMDGVRAGAFVLDSYSRKHKIDTIDGIISRFCTGNKKEYAAFLSKELGLKPNEKFEIRAYMSQLLRAMTEFESGYKYPEHYFSAYDLISRK